METGFRLDFRFGIALSIFLLVSGTFAYFYSSQVTYSYPVQIPFTYYVPYQRQISTATPPTQNDYLHVQDFIEPLSILSFGYYDARQYEFNQISFNFDETATTTNICIRGLSNGIVWSNISTDHDIKYIGVYSNDSYRVEIYNPSHSSSVFVNGVITFVRIEYITEQLPQTGYNTEYRTASYTDYPARSVGALLLVGGILVGVGTGVSRLMSRRRMKETL